MSDDYSAKIDSLIKTTEPRIFNGVILISKDEEILYQKEFGYSDFIEKKPISIEDRFRIMSNSKQVTAVLALRQVERGNLDLDYTINEYLPGFDQTWADSVTIHQLLNMSSGIVGLNEPLLFKPGEGYHYSNPGYGIMGRIIHEVSGVSFAENANNLFEELGMVSSYCYEVEGNNEGLVDGHSLLEGELNKVDFSRFGHTNDTWRDFLPAGGMVSTATDLNTWDKALHGGKILNPDNYLLMTTSTNEGPHAAFDYDTLGYGYGLRIHDRHPVKHLGHGGRGFGFVSIKFFVPEKNVDVIVWENIYHMDGFPKNADIIYHFENEIRKIVLSSNLVR